MPESVPTATAPSLEGVDHAIERIRDFLFSIQEEGGYWNCELPIDSTVACDYLLYFHWTGDAGQIPQDRIAAFIKSRQNPDGGWPQFPGGPSEINATVKGYHALKLAGESPNADLMVQAKEKALELGGVPAMCTWHKLYLAMAGCFPWKDCPLIPAEVMLLPKWFPVNIYRVSSWTRNMLVPLAVINHYKPARTIEHCPNLDELYPGGSMQGDWSMPWSKKRFSWKNFFLVVDKLGRFVNHLPKGLLRRRALRRAEGWICDRVSHGSDGMGAIFPAIMNVLVALECMGYAKDHWLFEKNRRHFTDLTHDSDWWPTYGKTGGNSVDGPKDWRIAPCYSPVWDTAIVTMAMAESGQDPQDPRLQKAADWLMQREIKIRGDWKENCDFPEAAGWAFEFNNDWYPDVDDTFQVVLGLKPLLATNTREQEQTLDRAIRWCRAMQCREGGFAAFDKDVNDQWLEEVPFADHNAILDPPCSDITGRALETLALMGYDREDEIVRRARAFLLDTQLEDGSWFGRWGVNYIYGTGHALRGLHAIGEDMSQRYLQRARNWLENCQNPDGGWGESVWTYHDAETKGQGPSTASQTAWALLGLLTFGNPGRPSIQRGVEYLLKTQREDGAWRYQHFTGTGFPRVFYLKYDSYQWSWPLYALAKYRNLRRQDP